MGLSTQGQTSPAKARLAFRVGVVGHRPNRLKEANLGQLSEVLQKILRDVKTAVETFAKNQEELFADGPPVLRALSPLAEGTDRMFAQSAIGLGYELCCPMPFPQPEYEKDFEDLDSLNTFRTILTEAKEKTGLVTFELDGSRLRESLAYGAAGRVVLNQ